MKADSPAELFAQMSQVLRKPLSAKNYGPKRYRSSGGFRPQHQIDNHNAHRIAKDPAYIAAEQLKNGHGPSTRATFVRATQKRLEVEATGARFANRIVLDETGKEVWV